MASSRGLIAVIAMALLLGCKAVPDLEFDNGRIDDVPGADGGLDVPDGRSPADATVYGEDGGSAQDAGSEEDADSNEDSGAAEEDAGACGTSGGPSCYCGTRACVGSGCPTHCNLCAAECQVCCIRVKPNGVPQAKCTKNVDKCKW